MVERLTDKRTVVGVPFYDGEGIDVLDACLRNIDGCLGELGVDAEIVVGINGPRVSQGQIPLSYEIDKSRFNANVRFIKTPPGLVNAEKTIGRRAKEDGYQRIFLTDADISRLPRAFYNMWHEGDKPVVGANYATYPLEVLIGAGIKLSPQEIAFMRIFEADKHPLAREFTTVHRPQKRLKGSLLLVDTKIIKMMFGCQGITSDSRMNSLLAASDKQVVMNAAFMHFARIDLADHVQARLRHFRAAMAENNLDVFARKSLIYSQEMANEIAVNIVAKYPGATSIASDFLLQCALRYQVAELCSAVAAGKKYEPNLPDSSSASGGLTIEVHTFSEASRVIATLFGQVDWDCLDHPVTNGKGITQGQSRKPIDLGPFLNSEPHKQLILSHLGLDEKAEI